MTRSRARLATVIVAGSALGWVLLGTHAPADAATGKDPLGSLMIRSVPLGLSLIERAPLSATQFAGYSPNPTAAAAALRSLASSPRFSSEVRTWIDPGSLNGVVDLVLALPSDADAHAYLKTQQATLDADQGMQRSAVAGIPGALRYAFLTSDPANGVEQVVVLGAGRYVATIRFISLITAQNPSGFSARQAEDTSVTQYRLLDKAASAAPSPPSRASSPTKAIALALGAGAAVVLVAVVLRKRSVRVSAGAVDDIGLPPPPLDVKLSLPMPAAGTEAGWLPDPGTDNGRSRYFDGHAWTEELRGPA